MAIELTRWFAHEARRVYAALDLVPADSESGLPTIIRRRQGVISPRGLMHASRRFRDSAETARKALQDLVDAGRGRWEHRMMGTKKPRLTEVFVLSGTPAPEGPTSTAVTR